MENRDMKPSKSITPGSSDQSKASTSRLSMPSTSSARKSEPMYVDPSKMSTKERMKRLQAICKEGQTPLSTVSNENLRKRKEKRVQHLDTPEGKRFICSAKGGISECLGRWMREGTRVMVKVRAFAPHCSQHEPNRILQGAIVAFDKHWNLILRDVDEVYVPPVRLGKVQTMAGAMPESVRYTMDIEKKGRPILARHLKCSFITGSSIILIHKEP